MCACVSASGDTTTPEPRRKVVKANMHVIDTPGGPTLHACTHVHLFLKGVEHAHPHHHTRTHTSGEHSRPISRSSHWSQTSTESVREAGQRGAGGAGRGLGRRGDSTVVRAPGGGGGRDGVRGSGQGRARQVIEIPAPKKERVKVGGSALGGTEGGGVREREGGSGGRGRAGVDGGIRGSVGGKAKVKGPRGLAPPTWGGRGEAPGGRVGGILQGWIGETVDDNGVGISLSSPPPPPPLIAPPPLISQTQKSKCTRIISVML